LILIYFQNIVFRNDMDFVLEISKRSRVKFYLENNWHAVCNSPLFAFMISKLIYIKGMILIFPITILPWVYDLSNGKLRPISITNQIKIFDKFFFDFHVFFIIYSYSVGGKYYIRCRVLLTLVRVKLIS
jgi:hypothetical protein